MNNRQMRMTPGKAISRNSKGTVAARHILSAIPEITVATTDAPLATNRNPPTIKKTSFPAGEAPLVAKEPSFVGGEAPFAAGGTPFAAREASFSKKEASFAASGTSFFTKETPFVAGGVRFAFGGVPFLMIFAIFCQETAVLALFRVPGKFQPITTGKKSGSWPVWFGVPPSVGSGRVNAELRTAIDFKFTHYQKPPTAGARLQQVVAGGARLRRAVEFRASGHKGLNHGSAEPHPTKTPNARP